MKRWIASRSVVALSLILSVSQAATVPDYAYTGDTAIKTLSFENDVTAIGEGAFAGSSLETACMPEGVTEIGAFAFADCRSLTRAVIPEGVKAIRKGTFRGCTSLREVALPSTIEIIEDDAFAATSVESVDLRECGNLLAIGDRCFAGCDRLRYISFPENLISLGDASFFRCTSLNDITLPESLQYIGDCGLACMEGIVTLRLPASLGYIGSNAMERMDRLSGIDAIWVKDVPRLGEDVWHGLDCHDIWLSVAPRMHDAFSLTPQWQDFNITGGTVSTVPVHEAAAGIKDVKIYRISEIDIKVTTYTDGSRRVEKILKTK